LIITYIYNTGSHQIS